MATRTEKRYVVINRKTGDAVYTFDDVWPAAETVKRYGCTSPGNYTYVVGELTYDDGKPAPKPRKAAGPRAAKLGKGKPAGTPADAR